VFVDLTHQDPQQRLGRRVIEGDTIKGSPDESTVRGLLEHENEMRSVADQYISQQLSLLRDDLQERRHEETQEELSTISKRMLRPNVTGSNNS